MFDAGFSELLVIMVLALLVVGPERLPSVARKIGLWIGRAKKLANSVRSDIERELRTEELEKMLNDQKSEIESLKSALNTTRDDTEKAFEEAAFLATRKEAPTDEKPKEKAQPAPLPEPAKEPAGEDQSKHG